MSKPKICALCLEEGAAFKCSRCGIDYYCNTSHQALFWPAHRYFCGHDRSRFRHPDLNPKEEDWNRKIDEVVASGRFINDEDSTLSKQDEMEREMYLRNPTEAGRNDYLIYSRLRLFSICTETDYTDVCGEDEVLPLFYLLSVFQFQDAYLRSPALNEFTEQLFHQFVLEKLYQDRKIESLMWLKSIKKAEAIFKNMIRTEANKCSHLLVNKRVVLLVENWNNVMRFATKVITKEEFEREDLAIMERLG